MAIMSFEGFDDPLIQWLQLRREVRCKEHQFNVGKALSIDLVTLEVVHKEQNLAVVVLFEFSIPPLQPTK